MSLPVGASAGRGSGNGGTAGATAAVAAGLAICAGGTSATSTVGFGSLTAAAAGTAGTENTLAVAWFVAAVPFASIALPGAAASPIFAGSGGCDAGAGRTTAESVLAADKELAWVW